MTPINPPTPDDFDAAGPLIDKTITAAKWIAAVLGVGWVCFKEILRAGVEKRRYEELREDVDDLKKSRGDYLLISAHDDLTELCHARLAKLSAEQLNTVVSELKDDMSTMNANLCHLMGHMQVDPVATPKRRRRTD